MLNDFYKNKNLDLFLQNCQILNYYIDIVPSISSRIMKEKCRSILLINSPFYALKNDTISTTLWWFSNKLWTSLWAKSELQLSINSKFKTKYWKYIVYYKMYLLLIKK